MKLLNVLLVEDDKVTTLLTKRVVGMNDTVASFVATENGLVAVNYLENLIKNNEPMPDVILLDINMPILDGWGFLDKYVENIAAFGTDRAIYVCSSSVSPYDINKAKSYNTVVDFISKPIKRDTMAGILNAAYAKKANVYAA